MVAAQGKRPWAFFFGTFPTGLGLIEARQRFIPQLVPPPAILSRRHRHFLKPGLAAGLLFLETPRLRVRRRRRRNAYGLSPLFTHGKPTIRSKAMKLLPIAAFTILMSTSAALAGAHPFQKARKIRPLQDALARNSMMQRVRKRGRWHHPTVRRYRKTRPRRSF
jgi:hypothetical protein